MRVSARHAQRKAVLGAVVGVLALAALGFGLLALTLALAKWLGLIPALLILCAVNLAGTGIAVAMLSAENRKARELAARRAPLDRDLARAALMAAPGGIRHVPRGLVGAALVLLGAALVVTRKQDKD